jgi:hypothetical protein
MFTPFTFSENISLYMLWGTSTMLLGTSNYDYRSSMKFIGIFPEFDIDKHIFGGMLP